MGFRIHRAGRYAERMTARIIAVGRSERHTITKPERDSVTLVEGWGIEGDAHAGKTVMHRYDRKRNPAAANLRQVHLIHSELFDELAEEGFVVKPGQMGENLTTRGIDLLSLSRGTVLGLGNSARIMVTGLRHPCSLIDKVTQPGVMKATLEKRSDGTLGRKAGVMAVVTAGGVVRPGDAVTIIDTPCDFVPLEPV